MYNILFVAPSFLALCALTAGLTDDSFGQLHTRTEAYLQDYDLNSYLSAREAELVGDAILYARDYEPHLTRRSAGPQSQLGNDLGFGAARLYARAPGRNSKGRGGGGGSGGMQSKGSGGGSMQSKGSGGAGSSSKKPPTGAPKGEPSDSSKSSRTAVPETYSKNQLLSIVKQHYDWPPPGYSQMSKQEKVAAAAKIRQQGPKPESPATSPQKGNSVKNIASRFEAAASGGTPIRNPAASEKDKDEIPPVSRPAGLVSHGTASTADSWSRPSSVHGVDGMSRQNSDRSGVLVSKSGASSRRGSGSLSRQRSATPDGWTVVDS